MSVENGGSVIQLTVNWNTSLLDIKDLRAKWLIEPHGSENTFSRYLSQFLGFENSLLALRECVSDGIESTDKFPLTC